MNLKALARRVVRYFRQPATSVSPEKAPNSIELTPTLFGFKPRLVHVDPPWMPTPAALDRVEEAANRVYWSATGIASGAVDERPGIKPPDVWTWEAWAKEFSSLAIDGWSPCRFAHRAGRGGAEKAVFVFGVVRGAFGLWQQPFDVCCDMGDGYKSHRDTLTVVTHLRSGVGMGIFATTGDAAQACNLASRLAPWEAIEYEHLSMWAEAAQRTVDAWHEFGILASVNAHAHDPDTGSGPLPIMGLSVESASEGKPEKLS